MEYYRHYPTLTQISAVLNRRQQQKHAEGRLSTTKPAYDTNAANPLGGATAAHYAHALLGEFSILKYYRTLAATAGYNFFFNRIWNLFIETFLE